MQTPLKDEDIAGENSKNKTDGIDAHMYIERACRDQIDEIVKEGTYIFKYSLRTQEIFVIYKVSHKKCPLAFF